MHRKSTDQSIRLSTHPAVLDTPVGKWTLEQTFNSTSRYLDDLLSNDNIYFDQMVDRIYPTELQLNRTNSSDTETPFLDLYLCISNGTISIKIYDKRDDFDFDIVNFPFLDGDVPGVPHMGYTYLNLLDSPELLQILMTLTAK